MTAARDATLRGRRPVAPAPPVRTAIVLQGGGPLGAYEAGVLEALYRMRPGFSPSVVTGISIGAVTAAVLAGARRDPIAALGELWRERFPVAAGLPLPGGLELALGLWGNPGMYRLRAEALVAPWLATSIYDTTPLRRTLEGLIDEDRLNDGGVRVIVGAVDVADAEARFFDNRHHRLTIDHIMASASMPPGFPMTEIDGRFYWDGGLFSNTPLGPAISALEEVDDGDRSCDRELIAVEVFPMKGTVPDDMAAVLERMLQLHYAARLRLDQRFFARIDQMVDLVEHLDGELPADSPVRRDPRWLRLRRHRKIDRFAVVSAQLDPELTASFDFTPATIEAHLAAGYEQAVAQGIAAGHVVDPGPEPGGRRAQSATRLRVSQA